MGIFVKKLDENLPNSDIFSILNTKRTIPKSTIKMPVNIKTENKCQHPIVAVDMTIFTVQENTLQVLLIQMKKKPFQGKWALPGGLVKINETLDEAAKRILAEETNVRNVYLEQLYSFSDLNRDPHQRVISVAYFALINAQGIKLKTIPKYADVQWFSIKKVPSDLAYDHKKILKYALTRLKSKLEYTNIVYGLLPKKFTLSQLQKIYEVILNRKLDKRNFRKKILFLDLLKPTSSFQKGKHRPARLYEFKKRKPMFVEIL